MFFKTRMDTKTGSLLWQGSGPAAGRGGAGNYGEGRWGKAGQGEAGREGLPRDGSNATSFSAACLSLKIYFFFF